MLDALPRESEGRSWAWVLAGVAIIYATIPVARALRETVDAVVGRDAFLYVTLATALAAAILAFGTLFRRRLPVDAYLCMAVITAAFLWFIYDLRDIPEEAIHVTEYGALGMLIYRALTHRIRDYSIYLITILAVSVIGILDEYIQWVVPSRIYELRDIAINVGAGALSQVAIATGLRPRLISRRPDRRSWSRLCYFGAGVLALLSLSFINTPPRVAWYAVEVPGLSFLLDSQSAMVEYGYHYDDPETGFFRSRFSRDQLRRLNVTRGHEAAEIIDRYARGEDDGPSAYSVVRDPYVHEIGVRVYRREYHLDRARENTPRRQEHYTIAYRENLTLKTYFHDAIQRSVLRWDEATELEVGSGADKGARYESAVSATLITRLSEFQVLTMFALAITVLGLLGKRLGGATPGGRAAGHG